MYKPMKPINTKTAEHYKWGTNSDGWHLLKSDSLTVIEECVPSGESEQRHYHEKAQQFFYVLSGTAHLEVDGVVHKVKPGSGFHVPAKVPHQLVNMGSDVLRFLVISEPKSHGDRTHA